MAVLAVFSGDEDADPEERWHVEMLQIHSDAKAIDYHASYFIQMVSEPYPRQR